MSKQSVLIIDDDPSHLRIYGWIIEAAGFDALTAAVSQDQVDLPESAVDLVLLDYHLHGRLTAPQVAEMTRAKYADAPIFVLSDALMMPHDIAALVDGFIRKGDPARLVATVSERLQKQPS